jgi:tetratricopeptide (TPR) repeat protein
MKKDRGPILSFLVFIIFLALFLYPRASELRRAAVDRRTTEPGRREILSQLGEMPPPPPPAAVSEGPPPALPEAGPHREAILLLQSAAAFYFMGDFRDSLDFLEEAALHPGAQADDLFRCVQLADWMKEYWLAASIGDAFLQASRPSPPIDQLTLLAQVYADAGEVAKAVALWATVYRTSPDDVLRRKAAKAASDLDPSAQAISLYRDYLTSHPGDLEMRERLARLYQANRDLGAFVRELEFLLLENEARDDWRSEIIAVLSVRRDYERLKPHLERMLREGKGEGGLEDLYLQTLDETGSVDALVLELKRRLLWTPQNADLLRRLGVLQESRLWLEESADCWRRLFELGEGDPDLWTRGAAIYELKGMWGPATDMYRKLHARNPGDENWGQKLADLHEAGYERETAHRLHDAKDDGSALQAALHRLTHDPSDADMLNLAGGISFDQGDFSASRDLFRRLVELKPDDPDAVFMLSESSAALKDEPEAKRAAQRVLEILARLPETPERSLTRTLALLRVGQERETRQGFIRLLEHDSKNVEITKRYAWFLLNANDLGALRELLERWRALDPFADELHEISAIALRRQGRTEEAALELKPEPGRKVGSARVAEYAEVLLELGRWREARQALQEQEAPDPRTPRMLERIDALYGPESSASFASLAAKQTWIERTRETTKAFVSEPLWVAEDGRWSVFSGNVPALGRDERVDLEEGRLEFGYILSPSLQLVAGGGGWEENQNSHGMGLLGVDLKGASWTFSLDVEGHRPWDTFVESVAFEGQEDRLEAQGEGTLDFLHFTGQARVSRYEVLDLRQLLDRHRFGSEVAFTGRLEARLWSHEDLGFGAGFWDETLRREQERTPHVSLVYQFSFDEFLDDPKVLSVIPLVRRSTAHLAGIAASWVETNALFVSGEFLAGADPARNLGAGKLYNGTLRAAFIFSRKALLDGEVSYISEQLKVQGGGSWQFQVSLNLNF